MLPKITCDFPHDGYGRSIIRELPDDELAVYQESLGHFQIREKKVDLGAALQ